jgi:hypothetical protein
LIVLDEQLNPLLINEIQKWYRGRIVFVSDLRPDTIIKDEVIPQLLARTKKHPAFVTINSKDFWKKTHSGKQVCIVCLKLEDSEMSLIPLLLRNLFQAHECKNKKDRAGYVFRIDRDGNMLYHSYNRVDIKRL